MGGNNPDFLAWLFFNIAGRAIMALVFAGILLALMLTSGCATNPCSDNPRSMGCMSADELSRELAK